MENETKERPTVEIDDLDFFQKALDAAIEDYKAAPIRDVLSKDEARDTLCILILRHCREDPVFISPVAAHANLQLLRAIDEVAARAGKRE